MVCWPKHSTNQLSPYSRALPWVLLVRIASSIYLSAMWPIAITFKNAVENMLIPPLKIIFAPSCARVSKLFANSLQNLTCADMRGRRRLAAPIETISDIVRRIARYRQTFMFAARDMPLTGGRGEGRTSRPPMLRLLFPFSVRLQTHSHINCLIFDPLHYV